MKHFSIDPFRNWFGYTRRERRSTFILLIIIGFVAGVRFIVPHTKTPVEIVTLELPARSVDTLGRKKEETGSRDFAPVVRQRGSVQIINLNTCDSAALEALPGIGPVLSARIIKYRNLLGGFATVDQLMEVYGLSEETYNLVKGRVMTDPLLIRKFSINQAEFKQIIRLPYFEKYEVTSILRYRELKGKIKGMDELVDNKILTKEKAEKVKWYLEF